MGKPRMSKFRFRLQSKLMVAVIMLGLALAILISFLSYMSSKDALENQYATRVIMAAKSAAAYITAEDVKVISAENGNKTENYNKVFENMNSFRKANELVYLYLLIPGNDSMRVLVDTNIEGDDPDGVIPYNSVLSYSKLSASENDLESYRTVYYNFKKNKAIDKPRLTDNEYGSMYGAAAPVLDENGKAVAMISTTISMGEVRDYLNNYLMLIVLLSSITIAILIILFILFVRKCIVSPIIHLKNSTAKIVTNNIDSNISFKSFSSSISTRDEIQELSETFNYMLEELDLYIDNLQSITSEKERIGVELNVATKIQSSMLPRVFPAFPERKEFDIFASMLPAREVGGDFYDFFLIDDDHLGVAIADVSGKGVPAALFMVIAKTLIKNHAQSGACPAEIFRAVNNQLCENNDAEMFVTAFMGILEISSRKFTYVNAGHNKPLVKRANGDFEWLETEAGFVLAGLENIEFCQEEIILGRGDTVYMYTDGVTEAVNRNEELFSDPRLIESINKYKDCDLKEMLISIKSEIDTFADGADQFDDITMLAFKIN